MNFTLPAPMVAKLFRLFLILPILLLHSCIEGEEEIWIKGDGSGRLVAHYSLPSLALQQLGDPNDYVRAIKMIDEREDGIEVQKITFESKSGKAVLHLEATFKNAMDLLKIADRNQSVFVEEAQADPAQLDALSGTIEVGIDGLSPTFNRAVSLGPIFPSMVQKSPAMLGKSTFNYTIHLPAEAKETNAHEVSEDRLTVKWTFLLKEYVNRPMIMAVKTALPIPWWVLTILGAIVFMIAWIIWKRLQRRSFATTPAD